MALLLRDEYLHTLCRLSSDSWALYTYGASSPPLVYGVHSLHA